MQRVLIVEATDPSASGLPPVVRLAFPAAEQVHAASAALGLRLLREQRFDLVLVDPQRLDDGALRVVQATQAHGPQAMAVIVTCAADDDSVFTALRAGAFGYLLKEQSPAALAAALRGMAVGEPALSPAIARRVLRYFAEGGLQAPPPEQHAADEVELNPRETEILQRVAKGFTLPEIGVQLGLSRHTVADYVKQIYRKLNVSSRAEAALEAARRGLVRP